MGAPTPEPWVTIELTWQRVLAALCVFLALATLTFAFIVRPAVSGYVGRQVSERIGEEVAAELAQAVAVGLIATPAPQPGAQQSVQPVAPPAAAGTQPQPAAASGPQTAGTAPPAAVLEPQTAGTAQAGPTASAGRQTQAGAEQDPGQAIVGAVTGQLQAPPPGGAQQGGEPAPGPLPGGEIGAAEGPSHAPVVVPPTTTVATPISAPQSERSLEQVVAALPQGEITVTEAKLNARIGPRVAAMAPIEGVVVSFVPGLVQVRLTVFGQTNLAAAGLSISGGQVVVQQPRIDGPLGLLVSPDALVRPIEEELNSILVDAGREVQGVRIEQGQIVVTLS